MDGNGTHGSTPDGAHIIDLKLKQCYQIEDQKWLCSKAEKGVLFFPTVYMTKR